MSAPSLTGRRRRRAWTTLRPRYVASFFLWTSGIHVGIVAADPDVYRHFADASLLPGLSAAWRSTFMTHATSAGLLLAGGELVLALTLLGPWAWRRAGWVAVISFHGALMCFGWGFWLWSVPAIAVLARGALADRRHPDGPWSSDPVTLVDSTR